MLQLLTWTGDAWRHLVTRTLTLVCFLLDKESHV
jgi:hypothetical protein